MLFKWHQTILFCKEVWRDSLNLKISTFSTPNDDISGMTFGSHWIRAKNGHVIQVCHYIVYTKRDVGHRKEKNMANLMGEEKNLFKKEMLFCYANRQERENKL